MALISQMFLARQRPCARSTGDSGIVEVAAPKGSYDLNVWKSGYEAPTTGITVDVDLAVDIALKLVPEENSDDLWQM
jgi:hypothetical protein